MRIGAAIILALAVALGVAEAQSQEGEATPVIENGSKVELEYFLTDEQGNIYSPDKGKGHLTFIQGRHEVIRGLEMALDGMHVGEEKQITVYPADAYGEVDPNAFTVVSKDQIPGESLTVGMDINVQGEIGEKRTTRIREIREETVLLDLNNQLAGKTLIYDVKVLGIEPPGK